MYITIQCILITYIIIIVVGQVNFYIVKNVPTVIEKIKKLWAFILIETMINQAMELDEGYLYRIIITVSYNNRLNVFNKK